MNTDRKSSRNLIGPGLLSLLLIWTGVSSGVAAAAIQVDSASPSAAEQGTVGLDVTIKGSGFGTGSHVDFFPTGTTDPGGITVNNVRRKGPKQLVATIDIDADASLGDYDIWVETVKGSALFKVTVETTGGGTPPGGGDKIPPGTVNDLTVGLPGPGFNTIPVTWTATANDYDDPDSGPARRYIFRFSLDGPITDANFDSYNWADNGGAWGEEPGTLQSLVLADREFEPDTTYHVAVQATDFADNTSLVTNVEVETESFPGTSWVTEVVDDCLYYANDFDFDSLGNPVFVYDENCSGQRQTIMARWNGGSFVTEIIDVAVEGSSFFASDHTGEPTMVGFVKGKLNFFRQNGSSWDAELIERGRTHGAHLAYSEDGFPAVVYGMSARNGGGSCWLAHFNGVAWDKEVVDASTACREPRLAFDDAGNPALAYLDDLESDPFIDRVDTLKFAYWDGAAWNVEVADRPPGHHAGGPSVAYDPVQLRFAAAYHTAPWRYWPDGRIDHGPSRARFCERTAGEWECKDLETGGAGSLTFDTDGKAYVVTAPHPYTVAVATRARGSIDWVEELIDWGAEGSSIKLSPGGIPGISYDQYGRSNPNKKSLIFAKPTP